MGLFDSIRRTLGGDDSSTDESTAGADDATDDSAADDGPAVTDSTEMDPDEFRERAEAVAARSSELDFTVESLARLDTAVAQQYDGETVSGGAEETAYTANTVRFGSYLGEVLVRDLDGIWVRDDGWGVTVAGPDEELTVAVFDVAARSFADEPVFAAVVERLETELDLPDESPSPVETAGVDDDAGPETGDTVDDGGSTEPDTPDADASDDETPTGWDDVGDEWQPATEKADSGLDDIGTVADTPDRLDDEDDEPLVIPDAEGGVAAETGDDPSESAPEPDTAVDDDGPTTDDPFGPAEPAPDTTPDPGTGNATGTESGGTDRSPSETVTSRESDSTEAADAWDVPDDGADDSAWPPEPDASPTADRESSTASDPTDGDGLRAEYATEATDFAAFWGEHDLDFTPDSLARLDALVDEQWAEDRFAEATYGETDNFEDRSFTNLAGELASYFGEVLVRELDGQWTEDSDHEAAVVVPGPEGPLAVPVFRIAINSLRAPSAFVRSYDALLEDLGHDDS